MADVRPFQGLRYSQSISQHLDAVLAPPFDVVSPDEQRALLARDAHNVIAVELGEIRPTDTDSENRYTQIGRAHV